MPSFQPRRRRRNRGFTLLEVMIAAGLFLFCVGAYIEASFLLNRLVLDNEPRVRALEAHLEVMKANLATDAASSDGGFAFATALLLDGAPLRTTTWTAVASPDYPPLALNASAVQSAMAAGFTSQGRSLTSPAPAAGTTFNTVLFLRGNGRIAALWEIRNEQTTVGGVAGLQTTITRYVDEGAVTLALAGTYQQFIAGATLAQPGGAGSVRVLAGASMSGTDVRLTFPAPQMAGELLALSGTVKPESASANVVNVDVQADVRPRL